MISGKARLKKKGVAGGDLVEGAEFLGEGKFGVDLSAVEVKGKGGVEVAFWGGGGKHSF